MNFNIEYEQELKMDVGWRKLLGVGLLGVLACGNMPDEAIVKSEALALRALAERNDLRPGYDL